MKKSLLYILTLSTLGLIMGCKADVNSFELSPPQIEPLVAIDNFRQEVGLVVDLGIEVRAIAGLQTLQVFKNDEPFQQVNYQSTDLIETYNFQYEVEPLPDGTLIEFRFELTDQDGEAAQPYTFNVLVGPPFFLEEMQHKGQLVTEISGRINRDITLSSDKTYLINGLVSVEGQKSLTIEPGTTVLMRTFNGPQDSRLAITQGSRLVANGTKDAPIVFTSDRTLDGTADWADWGGIFLYGRAPTNQAATIFEEGFLYGGNNTRDNSGSLRYVRIEYAGKADADAIQFLGVGSQTTIEFLNIYYCFDNAIRFKGGNADIRNAVVIDHGAYGLWAEHGWQGRMQFMVFQTQVAATIVPVNFNNIARSMEFRNDASNFLMQPRTRAVIANVTLIGNGQTPDDGTRRGFRFRTGAFGALKNGIVHNFPDDGVRVEDLPIEVLQAGDMEIDFIRAWGNGTNYDELAEDYFLLDPDGKGFNVTEDVVPAISSINFVGSIPSAFNPVNDPNYGNWFKPAPFIGAVQNAANDWTADGSWCRDQTGNIR